MSNTNDVRTEALPVAVPADAAMGWWSDAFAAFLRELDIPFMTLNPGASFRGLHDSIVNHLGNERPAMLLCLHEEHAVAIAHGYAKVTGQPMLVGLHTNVGLMHGSMAIFNAYCDRVPMLIIGSNGPLASDRRRPWIEWVHTVADVGAIVRDFTKWDDQPTSGPATLASLARANALTRTVPQAPVYVSLDPAVQESPLGDATPVLPDPARHAPILPAGPRPEQVAAVAELLGNARRPLILAGRLGRDVADWDRRVALAEALEAAVLTDLKAPAAFPTGHRLHPAAPGNFLTAAGSEMIRDADVILSLDWVDLGGTLEHAYGGEDVVAQVVSCSLDHVLHNGWTKDYGPMAPVDVAVGADPNLLVSALLTALEGAAPADRGAWPPPPAAPAPEPPRAGPIDPRALATALYAALDGIEICMARVSISWPGDVFRVNGPLDYLGGDGGGGIGSGPGMAVGAALALAGGDRLPVAVIGDGDYLMGCQALWTAARYELPMLLVVANNSSFFNDELHQERMAVARDRPIDNRVVGIEIQDPDPDLAALARSLGLTGFGPVRTVEDLASTLADAVAAAQRGEAVVVDVRTRPVGYPGGPEAPAPGSGA